MDNTLQLLIDSFWPLFKAGLTISVPLMLVSFILGLVVAFAVALMRMSKWKPLKAISWFYVWVIRGTPLIVQIFIIFFGLAYVGIILDPIPAAILALTISQGAYNSEVIRAALGSIPKGQNEACRALGLNKWQTMSRIIVPQAALVAVPSLGNSFISLLKDTSLVATITVHEIFQTAQAINAVKFQPLLLYIEAAFVYLIFSTVLTQIQGMLEKKLGKHLVDTRVWGERRKQVTFESARSAGPGGLGASRYPAAPLRCGCRTGPHLGGAGVAPLWRGQHLPGVPGRGPADSFEYRQGRHRHPGRRIL